MHTRRAQLEGMSCDCAIYTVDIYEVESRAGLEIHIYTTKFVRAAPVRARVGPGRPPPSLALASRARLSEAEG